MLTSNTDQVRGLPEHLVIQRGQSRYTGKPFLKDSDLVVFMESRIALGATMPFASNYKCALCSRTSSDAMTLCYPILGA